MRAILYSSIALFALVSLLPGQRGRRRSQAPAEMKNFTFEEEMFQSDAVDRRMPYGIYLPKDYDAEQNAGKTWPLVIWLHGMWEDHMRFHTRGGAQMLDRAVSEMRMPQCIFVTANAGRSSMYMNRGKERWQDLISKDLLEHVSKNYRVSKKRDERALMGVSMGGMGALRIAFTHPELFGAVAVHSSAVFAKDPEDMPDRIKTFAGRLGFGTPIDKELWQKVNPTCIADKLESKDLLGLRIYFDAGSDDRYGFDSGNELLHECLEKRKIAHQWRLIPGGGHSWGNRFQDRTLPFSFQFVGKLFRGEDVDGKPLRKGDGKADRKGDGKADRKADRKGDRADGGR
jgi:S-formylglutathione hydrolase